MGKGSKWRKGHSAKKISDNLNDIKIVTDVTTKAKEVIQDSKNPAKKVYK